ncbi:PLP-dependent aminotransferase family protein [Anaeromyxobacter dehalogenans]|uniref:Transcriptional regulator, GntR family n=1 Tax=Anaeromyxobacter dehalogenans (strain 2CP-C) TaxID=290397 RepID=Q2ILZ2_ANADE|nr:PLP-dependent aminotransferase family protein [Anaeromyxobacter dehalogenans]ABC79821.1 transcriptional regulator, GntR family [Anaeromyxobacter dehalogenans 2CP-C]
MRTWQTPLALDRADPAPLSVQIARALAARIRAGALRPGAPLPSSRALARTLGVHRNTVLAAYGELAAEGWIASDPARATLVSRDLPPVPRGAAGAPGPAARAGFDLPPAPSDATWEALPPGTLELLGGTPDPRLVPVAALGSAYRRALRRREHLAYGDAAGHPRLRAALARMLGEARGLAVDADGILVTRGAQMALSLAGRALLSPGDGVAVEALGYRPAWESLRLAGLRTVPVPVDARGLEVERLEALAAAGAIRAVYLTPHHQYPTTVTLAPARRLALLDLARRARLLVLEDDYDAEFHYEGRPVPPLASADGAGVVVYVGTLSKVLAPGLRLGWLAGPPDAIERLTAHRRFLDRQGDLAVEAAVAELFEEGEAQRHAWRTRRVYAGRREALAAELGARLGGALSFRTPAGGMALWCRVAPGIDPGAWAARALRAGVAVQPGRLFAHDRRARPFLRLGFGRLDARELAEAVRRLAGALPRRGQRSGASGA